jgi:hypothetical protein
MPTAVISVPLSQIWVSLGGNTEVAGAEALQAGIGAIGTGLAAMEEEEINPDSLEVAHLVGSRSPPRLTTPAGALNGSQNAGALKLQFADGVNVDVCAKALLEASTKGKSAIVEAIALVNQCRALRSEETKTKRTALLRSNQKLS